MGISLLLIGYIAGVKFNPSIESVPVPQQSTVPTSSQLTVKTLKLKPVTSYQINRFYTGEVTTNRESKLGFERGGKVIWLGVDEGDRITKGTPIAKLDTQNLEAKRLELQAKKDQAEAVLAELKAGARKEQIRFQEGAVKQLAASIADIDITLAKSIMKAPFSGAIAQRYLDEGTAIATGQEVFRLVENGRPEVRIGVPVSKVSQVRMGSQQTITIGQKNYSARVSSILPEVDPATRTQTLVLTLGTDARFKVPSGKVARLALSQTVSTNGYWLPITALIKGERGLWSCYALAEETGLDPGVARVEQRDIEVLHTEGDRALVRGTLQLQDMVIATGTQRVVPGQLVGY